MARPISILVVALLLSGCEHFKPVSADEARAVDGQYMHRTDMGGYYQYDNGARVPNLPNWHR